MEASDVIPILGVLEAAAGVARMRARSASPACEVEIVTDLDDPRLKADWEALECSGFCTSFQTRDFVRSFFATVGAASDARPVIAVLRDRHLDLPAMIIPLCLRRRRGAMVVEGVDGGLADYLMPVMREDVLVDAATMAENWRAVLAALPPAAVVHLKKVPATLGGRANPLALIPGMRAMGTGSTVAPIDAQAATPSRNTREQFRRLAKLDGFSHVVAENPAQALDMFDAALRQRRARAAEAGTASHLDAPGVAAFYRALIEEGVPAGTVTVQGFRIGGAWAAVTLSLVRKGRVNVVILTHEDGHGKLMLGYSLLFRALQWAHEAGHRLFDLGVGEFSYKKRFAGEPIPLMEYVALRRARGLLAWADAYGRLRLRAAVKRHGWLRAALRPWLGAQFGA